VLEQQEGIRGVGSRVVGRQRIRILELVTAPRIQKQPARAVPRIAGSRRPVRHVQRAHHRAQARDGE